MSRTVPASVDPGELPAGRYLGAVSPRSVSHGFAACEISHVEGRALPPHGHRQAYFCLLVSGRYREQAGSQVMEYRPSQLGYHPPHLFHRDEIGIDGATFFNIEVDLAALDPWIDAARAHTPGAPRFVGADLSVIAAAMHAAYLAGGSTPAPLEGYGWELLSALAPERATETGRPRWIDRCLEILSASVESGVSVAEVAALVNLHPVHVSREFRRRFRRTIGEHLELLRVEAACALLAGSDEPLTDVAARTGFADQSHFTRAFKRRIGLTPGRYRRLTKR